jgi:hypothetical protein
MQAAPAQRVSFNVRGTADATREERHRRRTSDEQSGADVAVLASCRRAVGGKKTGMTQMGPLSS